MNMSSVHVVVSLSWPRRDVQDCNPPQFVMNDAQWLGRGRYPGYDDTGPGSDGIAGKVNRHKALKNVMNTIILELKRSR